MPMGLNIRPALWQTYINTILEDLQIKNNYLAIMIDLLVHSITIYTDRCKETLKELLKNCLKISPRNANYLELTYYI